MPKDHCIHMQFFNQTEGKKMKVTGLLVLKQPNTIMEKILHLSLYCKGKKTCQCFKKPQSYFMGNAYIFVYMYLNLSLLRNYESFKYPHIQLTDTGGFISFIVKHKTGILKVKVYIEKVHLYHKALTT